MIDNFAYNSFLFVIVFFILYYILAQYIDYYEKQNEQTQIYNLNNERQKFQV